MMPSLASVRPCIDVETMMGPDLVVYQFVKCLLSAMRNAQNEKKDRARVDICLLSRHQTNWHIPFSSL